MKNLMQAQLKKMSQSSVEQIQKLLIINSLVFLMISVVTYLLGYQSAFYLRFGPSLYLVSSLLVFFISLFANNFMSPMIWFSLGSGVFFGVGALAASFHVQTHSYYLFGDSIDFLSKVNVLNSLTVTVVTLTYIFFQKFLGLDKKTASYVEHFYQEKKGLLAQNIQPIVWVLFVFAFVSVLLKILYFPYPQALLARSFLTKLYFVTPTFIWLSVCFWQRLNRILKFLFGLVLILEFFVALMAFSKLSFLTLFLAFFIGILVHKKPIRYFISGVFLIAVLFYALSPIISLGRNHALYDAEKNTIKERVIIFSEVTSVVFDPTQAMSTKMKTDSGETVLTDLDYQQRLSFVNRVKNIGTRFDVPTVQAYLIREFDQGRRGTSLDQFWAVFVPRVFWSAKPNVTRFGSELNGDFYYETGKGFKQTSSSLAPSFNGEAYWNFGYSGVVAVSFLLGIMLLYFSFEASQFFSGKTLGYLVILYQVVLWSANVEAWFVGSFLGEFVIYFVLANGLNSLLFFKKYINLVKA